MKKYIIAAAIMTFGLTSYGQTLNVIEGNVKYQFRAEEMGEGLFRNGTSLEIMGRSFNLSSVSAYVDNSILTDNTVTVVYADRQAKVNVAGNIAKYVTVDIDGADVSITQSPDVSADTCGEITYILSGASSDGSLLLTGSYKSTVELQGLDLASSKGAALDIQNGKRIELNVKKETVNVLADSEGGSQKGALVCKGHLELKGKGALTVKGNTAHAIYAKEYITLKNCTVNVTGAVKDGLNCNQYFEMESGELEISGVEDDGIQVSFKDDSDREPEDTGSISILGGKITVATTASATKAMKADGDIKINGGELILSVSGHGVWDSAKSKTKATACLGADGDVVIADGRLQLTASGAGGKGISCDGVLTINGGEMNVLTSGGIYAYVNGREYIGYTGNTDNLNSDYKSSPKGMKADKEVVINGGTVNVTTTGNGAEGIESKGELTINDGIVFIKAYDDAINSSNDMYIKGGDITVISTNNDGLDSNGNLRISGGIVRAFGARSPECGLDANDEQGYSVIFTGGYVLAVGGSNSTPSSSESVQPYVSGSATITAGETVTLKEGEKVLAAFEIPEGYVSTGGSSRPGGNRPGSSGGGVMISCPGLENGSSYTMTAGSSSTTVTAQLKGSGGNRPR